MKIYELKVDPKLPHHYFIAVAVKSMHSSKPGEMFLKYRPFYFHHSHIEKFRDVSLIIQDKLFVTSQTEALSMYGLNEMAQSFAAFKLAAAVNQCSIYHFSSEFEVKEDWFVSLVESANKSKSSKEMLFNAKVRS